MIVYNEWSSFTVVVISNWAEAEAINERGGELSRGERMEQVKECDLQRQYLVKEHRSEHEI